MMAIFFLDSDSIWDNIILFCFKNNSYGNEIHLTGMLAGGYNQGR
jgi:hypothetical protein